jgi:hypothetical protein
MNDIDITDGGAGYFSAPLAQQTEELRRLYRLLDTMRQTVATLANRVIAIDDRTAAVRLDGGGGGIAGADGGPDGGSGAAEAFGEVRAALEDAAARRGEVAEGLARELFVLGRQVEDGLASFEARMSSLEAAVPEMAERPVTQIERLRGEMHGQLDRAARTIGERIDTALLGFGGHLALEAGRVLTQSTAGHEARLDEVTLRMTELTASIRSLGEARALTAENDRDFEFAELLGGALASLPKRWRARFVAEVRASLERRAAARAALRVAAEAAGVGPPAAAPVSAAADAPIELTIVDDEPSSDAPRVVAVRRPVAGPAAVEPKPRRTRARTIAAAKPKPQVKRTNKATPKRPAKGARASTPRADGRKPA